MPSLRVIACAAALGLLAAGGARTLTRPAGQGELRALCGQLGTIPAEALLMATMFENAHASPQERAQAAADMNRLLRVCHLDLEALK